MAGHVGGKKEIFGPDQLIEVGGKLEVDAPADLLKRKKPRTDDTVEPVFFHSMPVAFYHEILEALNIIGVIDLSRGGRLCNCLHQEDIAVCRRRVQRAALGAA